MHVPQGFMLCYHGTHVAGIAAGKSFNAQYGDGVAPGAKILSIQVFSRFNGEKECGEGEAPCVMAYDSSILQGLNYVLQKSSSRKFAAANLSLGGGRFTEHCDTAQDGAPYKTVIDALAAKGVATVIAAGNEEYDHEVSHPGCVSSAVTVGATDNADAVAGFSNRGKLLDLFAPGVEIVSAIPSQNGERMHPSAAPRWPPRTSRAPSRCSRRSRRTPRSPNSSPA
nr:hypothetical protein GCM10020093_057370 [Planobispora longispora]